MNKTYALVWNPAQGCWNAVGETARRRGKSAGGKRLAAAAVSLLGFAALPAHALPTGEAITSGKADIVRSDDGKSMSINQHTDKLITNWQDFSVANGERVSFQQPGSQSIALNRVIGSNGSQIHGSIDANGKVFLVNPNGVLFGSGAQVNVGGLVASTQNIADKDFLDGNYRFSGNSTASIVNDGKITAADNGSVALLGARVSNNGTIQAKMGSVALGAGNAFSVSFDGNGLLNLQVEGGAVDAQVNNGGLIKADGGNVLMSARAADNLLNAVVNHTGTIEAKGLASRGGKITLDGGTVNVAGTLDASAGAVGAPAGSVTTRGERVNVAANTVVDTRAGDVAGTWTIEAGNAGVDQAAAARNAGRSIDADTLSRNLGTTNVALTNTQDDLAVAGAVAWNSDNALTLTSRNGSVDLHKAVSASGTNARVLVDAADTIRINDAVKLTGQNAHFELDARNGHALANDNAVVTLSGKNASFRANGNDYTVLHTVDDLRRIDNAPAGRYVLGNTVNGKGTAFRSIGGNRAFSGTFDGLGNTIERLAISNPGGSAVGLFGYNGGRIANLSLRDIATASSWPYGMPSSIGTLAGVNVGTISNVKATNVTVTGRGPAHVGGLVGSNLGGTIDRATLTGRVDGDGAVRTIGGLVGENLTLEGLPSSPATIRNSHADVQVAAARNTPAGGLVGRNSGRVEHSTSAGSVSSTDDLSMLGGLIGVNSVNGAVASSSSSANVTGRNHGAAGGLVGTNWGSIADSHATGTIRTGDHGLVGGLAGINNGDIRSSSANGSVIAGASAHAGGLVGWNHETGTIRDAQANGSVTVGNGGWAGGLAGFNAGDIDASAANSTVVVEANGVAGGLVGYNDQTGSVHASTARGTATGAAKATVGGLVGQNDGVIETSSADTTVTTTDQGKGGGFAGNNSGYISDSYASGNVYTNMSSSVGGFAGFNTGTLDGVSASGSVAVSHGSIAGGLVGTNRGSIEQSQASGNVGSSDALVIQAGGLVGTNSGDIIASDAIGNVTAGLMSQAGGLVGLNQRGSIVESTASGNVEAGQQSDVGGLVGNLVGRVTSSAATGSVKGGGASQVGGLVGANGGTIDASSSSGTVSGGSYAKVGGLVGGNFGYVYRSTTSSLIDNKDGYPQSAGALAGINYRMLAGNSATGNNGKLPLVGSNYGQLTR